jgi:hypothetical protein
MPHSADDMTLAKRHYVTLVLRLTLDGTGRLLQGELVDTTDRHEKPFLGLAGLHQAVDTWFQQQEQPAAGVSSADLDGGNQRGDS